MADNSSELMLDELKKINSNIEEIKSSYSEFILKEKEDSEASKVQSQLENEEQEKVEIEQKKIVDNEKKLDLEFKNKLYDEIQAISKNSSEQLSDTQLEELNKNITELVSLEKENLNTGYNQEFYISAVFSFLLVVIGGHIVVKILSIPVSKIINIIR